MCDVAREKLQMPADVYASRRWPVITGGNSV